MQKIRSAENLILTISVDERPDISKPININGTLTLNGSPVTDALVSMQINNPRGNIFMMRVFTTGQTPQGPWPVEITNFYLCDVSGNPKYNFKRGGALGYTITVQNNGASPQYAIVILTFTYSSGAPFSMLVAINETLEPGVPRTSFRYIEEFIPSNAPLGPAYVYAVAVNNLTQYGGIAWCPENSTTFNIVSSSGSLILNEEYPKSTALDSTPGAFSVTIKIPDNGGILGNYTIYANSWYNYTYAQEKKIFQAILTSDINRDGTVDMADISILIEKFMLTEDDPEWDPNCDLVKDGTIDMADISIAIGDYMKWGYY
jgi:hypothetical protein